MARFDWRTLITLFQPSTRPDQGSTGLGPDFPTSSGDRERGKHRPSDYPRLTMIAVCNDDGTPIGAPASMLSRLDRIELELQRLRLGLVAMDVAEDVKNEDMRERVR